MKPTLIACLALLLLAGCAQPQFGANDYLDGDKYGEPLQPPSIPQTPPIVPEPSSNVPEVPVVPVEELSGPTSISVTEQPSLKWTGGYADPSIIQFGGKYWVYLNQFGNGKETGVSVLSSSDGLDWKSETGVIFKGIATVRAHVIDDKVYVYYPQGGMQIGPNDPAAIIGATSTNAKTFTNQSKIKISPHAGYTMDGPGVFTMKDGTYRMYFVEFDLSDIPKREGKMWGASSSDGITWVKDDTYTMEPEANVEGLQPWPQILHPFIVEYQDGFIMFYNSHSILYWAYSEDGLAWEKRGKLLNNGQPIRGADVDGFWMDDTHLRLYYGDFSEQTLGVVYTMVVEVA